MRDKPEEFQPERFLNSGVDFKVQNFKFIPFGSGILFAINSIWTLPGGANAQDLDRTECTGSTIHRRVALLAVATPRC